MTVLTKKAILKAMDPDEKEPLVVTPLTDPKQIGDSSIDVRLGHEFIVFRRSQLKSLDYAKDHAKWQNIIHRSQERVRVSLFDEFVLHPGELTLGSTLEFISLPTTLAASVEGRSSWGRLGLIIATATAIGPGYKGCLTLEIVNEGEVPIVVYPGLKVAQIILYKVEGVADYRGKYHCPIGPEYPKPDSDWESTLWSGQGQEESSEAPQLLIENGKK